MARPITPILAAVGATAALTVVAATSSSAASPSTGGLTVSSVPANVRATSSPAVGPQQTWTRKTSPVDLPGTGIERGDRLPKGSVLVYRQIDIPKREKRRVRLVVPKGKKIETAAQSGSFGSGVINRDYVGTRSVTIRAAGGQNGAQGRLYAYAR